MIRIVLMFSLLSSIVFCQYPRQRAPPVQHRPTAQDPPLDDDYYYEPPVAAPPPPVQRKVLHKPASVHYVNIGAELAGDYKFGYDTGKADNGQSFREETRLPDGTVQGAYGYVDETGKQRIVKYTAGKDGFKVLGDSGSEATSRSAPARPVQTQPQQQAYRPAPQESYRPPAPQQSYRSPPPQQAAYNPPPVARAAPVEEYIPQRAYRAPVAPQRQAVSQSYAPRPRPRQQYTPEPVHRTRNTDPEDYDYPDNEIVERRIVPIDTTLFSYNIGTNNGK